MSYNSQFSMSDTLLDTPSQPSSLFRPSRRDFMRHSALAGGGLLLGGQLVPSWLNEANAQATDVLQNPFSGGVMNVFLRIGKDNTITVVCGLSEMGQGVHTSIPQILAEELDAPWERVRVLMAPASQDYANPLFGMQGTGGSTSVRGHYPLMRKMGAAARAMLISAAASRWDAENSDCWSDKGMVVHASGKKFSYGELAAEAARLPIPANPKLKDPVAFRIIGQDKRRLDTPAKVNGSAKFGMDVSLPGMLTAVMAFAPVPGAKPSKINDTATRAIPGVVKVITIPQGVAVLAKGYWLAKKGRDALEIEWDEGDKTSLNTASIKQTLQDGANSKPSAVARSVGAVDQVNPAKTVDVMYEAPFLAHACMEPMNSTAWLKGNELEIWAGTQGQGPSQLVLSGLVGLKPYQVKVNTQYLGGGFGRRFALDFSIIATLLSKAAGAPVKIVYTREDDTRAQFYRPASAVRFAGGLDANGNLISLKATVASMALTEATGFGKVGPNDADRLAVEGIKEVAYEIPNINITYSRQDIQGIQVWFLRSVGHSQNAFFMESFIDELATTAGKDPYEFRRNMLKPGSRERTVLETVASKANWGSPLPAGRARGIALHESFGSWVAEVAEVSLSSSGEIRVHRVVCAVDCGPVVNPLIVKRQMESAIAYGLSNALYGKITFKNGRVEQGNFDSYPILRSNEMPAVEVHIISNPSAPIGGVGEPGTPPIAPAVANAVAVLTGKRMRSMPFADHKLT